MGGGRLVNLGVKRTRSLWEAGKQRYMLRGVISSVAEPGKTENINISSIVFIVRLRVKAQEF